MDNIKVGNLICKLRKEHNMTQLQLAEQMHISDKAVSKWERGLGCPDVSLLSELSQIFAVDLEKLLSGELDAHDMVAGNMKNMKCRERIILLLLRWLPETVSCCVNNIRNGNCRCVFLFLHMASYCGIVHSMVYFIRRYDYERRSKVYPY